MDASERTNRAGETAEDSLTVIDSLRSSIEQEHRFKTSLMGYDRQGVQSYLQELSDGFQRELAEQRRETERLQAENAELHALVDSQRERLENLRAEERRKLQLEYDMQEGLVERLREKNNRLLNENQSRQVEITALREQLSLLRTAAAERRTQTDELAEKLAALLSAKLRECGDVIAAWKTEYDGIAEDERREVTES